MKKILALVLSLVISFLLVACGGGNETDQAKKTSEGFIEATKNIDAAKLHELIVESKRPKDFKAVDKKDLSEEEKITAEILSKMKYKFIEGEVKDGEKTVTLKYEIDGPTFASIQEKIIKDGNFKALEDVDTFLKDYDISKLESKKREVEFKLEKEENAWRVANPEELMGHFVGAY